MDTIHNMRIFVRVVESGSFTAAALSFDATTSAMSRAVSELETHLRTRLLNRTTRRLALTPAGEQYLERCRQILADIQYAEEEASGAYEHPAGTLRMHCFVSISQHYILPAIARYREQHPDVNLELTLSQNLPDLFDGSSDVSIITASTLPDSELVALPLGTTFSVLCASPAYLHTRGTPASPADLIDHDCLILKTPAHPSSEWTLEGPEGSVRMPVSGPLQVNVAESLIAAIREGIGIGMLPIYSAVEGLKRGELVRVLPEHTLHKTHIYALYPSRRFTDAKIRTWVEFLRGYLPDLLTRDEAVLAQAR